jgi:hypothetical protein
MKVIELGQKINEEIIKQFSTDKHEQNHYLVLIVCIELIILCKTKIIKTMNHLRFSCLNF